MKTYRPVLLVQGFNVQNTQVGNFVQYSYTTPSDRGQLKYLDMIFVSDILADVNEPGNFTVSVGGQNVIETEGFNNWVLNSQLGKDALWDVRTYAAENQTINLTMDTRLSIGLFKIQQLIAKYTTAEHEEFLKTYQLKFTPGIKRKGYQLTRLIGTVNTVSLEVQLPRQKGNIIGIGISNAGDILLLDQLNTLINVYIDGVKIIDKVCAGYFNIASGRDSYLNKIFILPGATMKIELEVQTIDFVGGGLPLPALQTITHDFCIYFGN